MGAIILENNLQQLYQRSGMKSNLVRLFGKLRRYDKNHADEGFQIAPDGEKIRVERRMVVRRGNAERRIESRENVIDRRIKSVERRIGVDWRAWFK